MVSNTFTEKQEMKNITHIELFLSYSLKFFQRELDCSFIIDMTCQTWHLHSFFKKRIHLIKKVHFSFVIFMKHGAINLVIIFTMSQTVFSNESWLRHSVPTNSTYLRSYFLVLLLINYQCFVIKEICSVIIYSYLYTCREKNKVRE